MPICPYLQPPRPSQCCLFAPVYSLLDQLSAVYAPVYSPLDHLSAVYAPVYSLLDHIADSSLSHPAEEADDGAVPFLLLLLTPNSPTLLPGPRKI